MTDSVELQEIDSKYGGLEGPEAMFVKLISSDGHEFIVKREHALTSGTIKAMLSGPGIFGSNNCSLFFLWLKTRLFVALGQFAENEANEINFREIP